MIKQFSLDDEGDIKPLWEQSFFTNIEQDIPSTPLLTELAKEFEELRCKFNAEINWDDDDTPKANELLYNLASIKLFIEGLIYPSHDPEDFYDFHEE